VRRAVSGFALKVAKERADMSAFNVSESRAQPAVADSALWLGGGGEMGARTRALDWRATALGPLESWPQSLRSAVSICLGSRFPMVVLWGPQLIMLYNDAYAPLLGDKHPGALGRSIREVWTEIADVIAPLMEGVMKTGEATWIPDGFLALERHGAAEETYFSYSFGPVRIEDGSVGGILAVTIETTERVISERRLAFLKSLADATAGSRDAVEVCAKAMAEVGAGTQDIRQAAIYLREPGHGDRLVAQSASGGENTIAWTPELIGEDLLGPHSLVVSVRTAERAETLGALVVALNPQRPKDEAYREFIALVGRQIARSISDIKALEMERARANAEQDLRRIFEQAPSFVCIMKGPDHVFEFVNKAHLSLFNSAAWLGKPARDAFPDLAGQGYFEQLDEVYRTGTRYIAASAPVRYRYSPESDEEERLLDFIYEPIRDEGDRITGIFCEGFDVTAQRRAEAALRHQEERLRALINSTSNVVYTMSPDWAEMRTLDGRGFIVDTQAPNRSWLHEYIHQDDHPKVLAAIHVAVRGKSPFQLEHRVRTVDGSLGWTFSRAVPILDSRGEIVEWFGAASDITARKRMEAELDAARQQAEGQRRLYEAILTNTPDLAYVFDLSHRFVYANDVLLRMWGKTWDEAIGKTCLELGYEPWHAELHDREIDQIAATSLPLRGEVPFAGAFGRRMYDYILVPVFGDGGEVVAVAGTTRDITEMKQMEETLRSQADQLREGDQRKDEFLGILAHELRNPLAPLKNGLEIIRRLAPQEPVALQKTRAMMDRQLAQMVRLIDDLLDVSRISSGKIGIHKDRVALADVVRHAVETSQPAIDQAGHKLTITSPGHAVFVDADPTRLSQVVSNLLTNAAKFTAAGGHIQLTTERNEAGVSLSVRDNGEGIPRDMLPRIFDMFVQVDRSLEREKSGLGIGLCLARGLVALHGGSIEARSGGPGHGSEFIVHLPVATDAGPAVNDQDTEARLEKLAPRRVLIVDDNIDAASSLAMLLELMGCETKVSHNGLDAVTEADEFRPELVFLDIGMPGLNGYEACARIKEMPWGSDMVVVALTGWGQEKDRLRSREAGFDGHLVKPVNPDAIKTLMDDFRLGLPLKQS
jgi:PAS domain S-box-containing protein